MKLYTSSKGGAAHGCIGATMEVRKIDTYRGVVLWEKHCPHCTAILRFDPGDIIQVVQGNWNDIGGDSSKAVLLQRGEERRYYA